MHNASLCMTADQLLLVRVLKGRWSWEPKSLEISWDVPGMASRKTSVKIPENISHEAFGNVRGSDDWGKSSTTWEGFTIVGQSHMLLLNDAGDYFPVCKCGSHQFVRGRWFDPETIHIDSRPISLIAMEVLEQHQSFKKTQKPKPDLGLAVKILKE